MNSCDEYLKKISEKLPDLCSPQDLVEAGIYRHKQLAYSARRRGIGPSFFRLGTRRIAYPKEGVLKWLENHRCREDEAKY
jgi:hypothetical protein